MLNVFSSARPRAGERDGPPAVRDAAAAAGAVRCARAALLPHPWHCKYSPATTYLDHCSAKCVPRHTGLPWSLISVPRENKAITILLQFATIHLSEFGLLTRTTIKTKIANASVRWTKRWNQLFQQLPQIVNAQSNRLMFHIKYLYVYLIKINCFYEY